MKSFDEWCIEFLTKAGFEQNAENMYISIQSSTTARNMYLEMYQKDMRKQKPLRYLNRVTTEVTA